MISEKSEDLEVKFNLLSPRQRYGVKVVKLLLERGAEVDAATYTGITPLQVLLGVIGTLLER